MYSVCEKLFTLVSTDIVQKFMRYVLIVMWQNICGLVSHVKWWYKLLNCSGTRQAFMFDLPKVSPSRTFGDCWCKSSWWYFNFSDSYLRITLNIRNNL